MKPFRFAPNHFEQEGWQGQLQRVERWHRRTVVALDRRDGRGEEDAIDFLYAFFLSAYHLRDWLQNSGAAFKGRLDALLGANHSFQLCRDVCNGSKHFTLNSRSRSDHVG